MPDSSDYPELSPRARRDIRDLLVWSLEKFGLEAQQRYSLLLEQAFREIAADSALPGSRVYSGLRIPGFRTYHIALSQKHVSGPRVKQPRHIILYRRLDDGVIRVARVRYDSRDLSRHFP